MQYLVPGPQNGKLTFSRRALLIIGSAFGLARCTGYQHQLLPDGGRSRSPAESSAHPKAQSVNSFVPQPQGLFERAADGTLIYSGTVRFKRPNRVMGGAADSFQWKDGKIRVLARRGGGKFYMRADSTNSLVSEIDVSTQS